MKLEERCELELLKYVRDWEYSFTAPEGGAAIMFPEFVLEVKTLTKKRSLDVSNKRRFLEAVVDGAFVKGFLVGSAAKASYAEVKLTDVGLQRLCALEARTLSGRAIRAFTGAVDRAFWSILVPLFVAVGATLLTQYIGGNKP